MTTNARRYTDLKGTRGKDTMQLCNMLKALFPRLSDLDAFVHGWSVERWSSIGWEDSLDSASFDLIQTCNAYGLIGSLLEALENRHPENTALKELIKQLVEAGYLQDNQKQTQESTNPRQRNWLDMYPSQLLKIAPAFRTVVIEKLVNCFTSAAEIERFVTENFPHEYGRQTANGIVRTQPLFDILEYVFAKFEAVGWGNAFMHAVHEWRPAKAEAAMNLYIPAKMMASAALTASVPPICTPAAAPPKQSSPPVAIPVAVPVAAKPVAATPKALTVRRLTTALTTAQEIELRDLLTEAFDRSDLNMMLQFKLGKKLDHIAGQGGLDDVCLQVVQRFARDEQIPSLLNAITEVRPTRRDIRAWIQQNAQAGILELGE